MGKGRGAGGLKLSDQQHKIFNEGISYQATMEYSGNYITIDRNTIEYSGIYMPGILRDKTMDDKFMYIQIHSISVDYNYEVLEIVMCDVIKIRQNGRDATRSKIK